MHGRGAGGGGGLGGGGGGNWHPIMIYGMLAEWCKRTSHVKGGNLNKTKCTQIHF